MTILLGEIVLQTYKAKQEKVITSIQLSREEFNAVTEGMEKENFSILDVPVRVFERFVTEANDEKTA